MMVGLKERYAAQFIITFLATISAILTWVCRCAYSLSNHVLLTECNDNRNLEELRQLTNTCAWDKYKISYCLSCIKKMDRWDDVRLILNYKLVHNYTFMIDFAQSILLLGKPTSLRRKFPRHSILSDVNSYLHSAESIDDALLRIITEGDRTLFPQEKVP